MRKLTRTLPPEVLQKFDYVQHTWDDVSPSDKASIRAALDEFQRGRCAYCDGRRQLNHHHIEHFRRKGPEPDRTFEWSNLFISCGPGGDTPHCGGFKDRQSYDVNLLLKPDSDNPQDYLHFMMSGAVVVRAGLSDDAQQRATCTITVFNLNHHLLKGKRRQEALRMMRLLGLDDLPDSNDVEFVQIVRDEIEQEIASSSTVTPFIAIWLDALRALRDA